jgi:uncharacterized membrane protein
MDINQVILLALRYIHFLAGITWIGVLYYFNFIQTPFFGTELGGQARGAMMRGLVPTALWWFRWGAMFTWLTGVTYLVLNATSYSTFALTLILTGGTLGTLMFFNVWVVIWPIQKIAIASAEGVAAGRPADPQAAARAPVAARASRTNTLFSIPMLFFMAATSHFGGVFAPSEPAYGLYWAVALALFALIELNIFFGVPATQKPLASVSGTIHIGLGLLAVLIAAVVLFL